MSTVAKSHKPVPILVRLRARVGRLREREHISDNLEETCEILWQQAKTLEGPKL